MYRELTSNLPKELIEYGDFPFSEAFKDKPDSFGHKTAYVRREVLQYYV